MKKLIGLAYIIFGILALVGLLKWCYEIDPETVIILIVSFAISIVVVVSCMFIGFGYNLIRKNINNGFTKNR